VQGSQGITGAQGVQGNQGITGAQGVQGIQGSTGVQGAQGVTGRTGVQGPQGVDGDQGATGIRGVTGAQGVQGVQGIQGLTGVRGSTGVVGAEGPQGPTGLLGSSLANQVQIVTGGWLKTGSGTKDSTLSGFQLDNLEFVAQVTGVDKVRISSNGVQVVGSSFDIYYSAATGIGKFYGANPLTSSLIGSAGVGIESKGYAALEAVQLRAKSASGRSAEVYAEAGNSSDTTRAVWYATAGVAGASSRMQMSMSLFELYIGNDTQHGWEMDTVGNIDRVMSGVNYNTAGFFVPLTTPLSSTAWDGDAYSTVATSTLIDLSAVFGVPAGVKAVLVSVAVRDSAAWGAGGYGLNLGPSSTYYYANSTTCYGGNLYGRGYGPVPCDANGDLYYRCQASGAGTLDIDLRIWGYWI